ncbi:secreted RxLR effector protein 161-like [Pistacia vera]|uniref:secreted RxLR effector protein 161-like n=1 Tax=Pistacia vera TaxID=55513 RepID=UPI0012636F14|nr:secreted RxLR effector protein 161-like [Pistacia vera]
MENIPYSSAIGSVMYSMISTRHDLSFAISLLSRFMSNPGIEHWVALKWTLRYINTTMHVGLEYCKRTPALDLVGWKSQLQPLVALSTTEVEYVAVTAFKEAIWLQGILKEINLMNGPVTISKETVNLLKIPTEENPSDMGTKVVTAVKFKHCLNILHIN